MDNNYRRKRIPQFDGLRGMAILLVIASHTNAFNLSGQGGIGVTIFFVLSGFLLAVPFVNNNQMFNLRDLFKFYLRRVKRILPMYYITLVLFIIFSPNFLGDVNSIVKHFLFIQANGHLWSTQQEMCFYLICPIIFYIIYMLIKKFKLTHTIIAIILIVISFLLEKYLTTDIFNLNGNGKQQVFRIFIFLFGISICYFISGEKYIEIKESRIFIKIINIISIISIFIMIFSAKYYKSMIGIMPSIEYVGWEYPMVFSVLSGIIIIAIISDETGVISKVFKFEPLISIGRVSYSMYLLHFLLLPFLKEYINENNTLFFCLTLITYMMSLFTYNFVEQFFITGKINIKKSN